MSVSFFGASDFWSSGVTGFFISGLSRGSTPRLSPTNYIVGVYPEGLSPALNGSVHVSSFPRRPYVRV